MAILRGTAIGDHDHQVVATSLGQGKGERKKNHKRTIWRVPMKGVKEEDCRETERENSGEEWFAGFVGMKIVGGSPD